MTEEMMSTKQVAQFNAENQWGIVVTASGMEITPACSMP